MLNRALGERVNYSYCLSENLCQVTGAVAYATFTCEDTQGRAGYSAAGQPGTITFGNGANTTLTYIPANNRLRGLISTPPRGGTVQNLSFNPYDLNGNIKTIADTTNSGNTQDFTYDGVNRLKTAAGPYNTVAPTYDNAGNILTFYDSQSTASRNPLDITYDLDNRATNINGTGFAYNYQGMRVRKTTGAIDTIYIDNLYEVTNGAATKHIFAGDRRIASKTATDTYYYHPDHLGSLSVLTNSQGSAVEAVTYYPFGEVRTNTKAPGSADPPIVDLPYKYTGQELDLETGLYYYKSRYYDPAVGRFITPDALLQAAYDPPTFPMLIGFYYGPKDPPIVGQADRANKNSIDATKPVNSTAGSDVAIRSAGPTSAPNGTGYAIVNLYNIAGPNPYVYVRNNPLNAFDPIGLWTFALGLTMNLQYGPISVNGSVGIVIDGNGNIGTYKVLGAGLGIGAGLSGGLSTSLSNAQTITDLHGPFVNTTFGAGAVLSGSWDYYAGQSDNGWVTGSGLTVGLGLGGGADAGGSMTWISPLNNSVAPVDSTQPSTSEDNSAFTYFTDYEM